MSNRHGIILAAGQGTRMKSTLYKVLHPVMGKPMVQHVLDGIMDLELDNIITIVGHGAGDVKEQLGSVSQFVLQDQQLGTGHAVQQAEGQLGGLDGTTIVVCGDTPLITTETYRKLLETHESSNALATILTAEAPDATGYGRIIRDASGGVERIVEHKDANAKERQVNEINTGTYCFDNKALFAALKQVNNHNIQGEYYLPDVISILRQAGGAVNAYLSADFDETLGVNDRIALSKAEAIMKKRINEKNMSNGVTITDPNNTYIAPDVIIESDVLIHPGSIITGKTKILHHAVIGPYSEIENCLIGEHTVVTQSVATDSQIGNNVKIGPYAHIRPKATIGNDAKVGNFVEVKKSTIGDGSKVSHLSYIGDANIGKDVNVGCGTITVNYDGKNKFLTTIEDDAFIGCNANLVAPVTVGKGAIVAAGSTITKHVPSDALSIARSRQTNKEGYAPRINKSK